MNIVSRFAIPVAIAALLSACAQNGGVPAAPATAPMGGTRVTAKSFGTVFAVTTSGKEHVVYRFQGSSDGAYPHSRLLAVSGTLYGTTEAGGANNAGTVFAVTPQGTETVLHSFGGAIDGADPAAGLINVNGTLYGTTRGGGTAGYGTVFSITTSGAETVLHSFSGRPKDGQFPMAPLLDLNGTLYGTTKGGGSSPCGGGSISGCGALFKMTPSGKESLVTSFAVGDLYIGLPVAALIAVGKELYGTAPGGPGPPPDTGGGVFKCSTTGKARVIHEFKGHGPDGFTPEAALTDVNGMLYGTTRGGGTYKSGVVFKVSTAGDESPMYEFGGSSDAAKLPLAGLIEVNGRFYGTTSRGGAYRSAGTVFRLTRSGAEAVIHSFGSAGDGKSPQSDLINVNGTLYGTTMHGGS
jgi:uncharacterized repeat protein (TIGR03803 family)